MEGISMFMETLFFLEQVEILLNELDKPKREQDKTFIASKVKELRMHMQEKRKLILAENEQAALQIFADEQNRRAMEMSRDEAYPYLIEAAKADHEAFEKQQQAEHKRKDLLQRILEIVKEKEEEKGGEEK